MDRGVPSGGNPGRYAAALVMKRPPGRFVVGSATPMAASWVTTLSTLPKCPGHVLGMRGGRVMRRPGLVGSGSVEMLSAASEEF